MSELVNEKSLSAPRFHEGVETRSLERFLKRNIIVVAEKLARYSLDPRKFVLGRRSSNSDITIAKALSDVEVLDDHLIEKPNLDTDEGVLQGITLTVGKAVSAIAKTTDLDDKRELTNFVNRVIDKGVSVISSVTSSKVARYLAELSLIVSAASSPVVVATPVGVSDVQMRTGLTQKFYPPPDVLRTSAVALDGSANQVLAESVGGPDSMSKEYIYKPDAEGQRIIDSIEKKYGVTVIMPKEYNGETSLGWKSEWLKYIDEGLSKFPPGYLRRKGSLKEIFLIRAKGSEGIPGGGAGEGLAALFIPEDFRPEKLSDLPGYRRLYGNNKNVIEALLLHEGTHILSYWVDPSVQEDFDNSVGWNKNEDSWANTVPDGLESIYYSGNGPFHFPPNGYEDLAVSVTIMAYSPDSLPINRKLFFLNSPFFKKWSAVGPQSNRKY